LGAIVAEARGGGGDIRLAQDVERFVERMGPVHTDQELALRELRVRVATRSAKSSSGRPDGWGKGRTLRLFPSARLEVVPLPLFRRPMAKNPGRFSPYLGNLRMFGALSGQSRKEWGSRAT